MANNVFPDDDPDIFSGSDQENQPDENKILKNKSNSLPAFEDTTDELDKMRRTMLEMESGNLGTDNPEEILPSTVEGQNSGPLTTSPFDDDDFDTDSTNGPFSAGNADYTLSENESHSTSNLWSDDSEPVPSSASLSQRISALQLNPEGESPDSLKSAPPFVMDDSLDLADDNNNSLTDKIRKGLVPAETLELLITKTMSEAEVISFAKKLGIDWNLTPGDTREEKTEFLVYYFNNRANQNNKNKVGTTSPQFSSLKTEDDWRESDSRLQALQQTLTIPETPVATPKQTFLDRLSHEFQQASPLERYLTVGLSTFAIFLVFGISILIFSPKQTAPIPPTPTVITQELPYPSSIEIPGGWSFNLTIGSVQGGIWNPKSPEWLQGTEICRLVSIPWNKQLDAVFKTFSAGDQILLTMSNKDVLSYKVESTSILKSAELNQLLNRDTPCLVVVYAQQETDAHQVIISNPDYTTPVSAGTQTNGSVKQAPTATTAP